MINNPRWVKWKHFNQDGYVGKDYMLKSDVSAKIKEFEKIAANLLDRFPWRCYDIGKL